MAKQVESAAQVELQGLTVEHWTALAAQGIHPTAERAKAARKADGNYPKGIPMIVFQSRVFYGSGASVSRMADGLFIALGARKDYAEKPAKGRAKKTEVQGLGDALSAPPPAKK